jgi:hypothetical protein
MVLRRTHSYISNVHLSPSLARLICETKGTLRVTARLPTKALILSPWGPLRAESVSKNQRLLVAVGHSKAAVPDSATPSHQTNGRFSGQLPRGGPTGVDPKRSLHAARYSQCATGGTLRRDNRHNWGAAGNGYTDQFSAGGRVHSEMAQIVGGITDPPRCQSTPLTAGARNEIPGAPSGQIGKRWCAKLPRIRWEISAPRGATVAATSSCRPPGSGQRPARGQAPVGIHVFSLCWQQRRGWPAFADHDEVA